MEGMENLYEVRKTFRFGLTLNRESEKKIKPIVLWEN